MSGTNLEGVRDLFGKSLQNVNPANNDVPIFSSAVNAWIVGAGGGGGEANTSSNVGGGEGLALPKVVVDLPFKSLIGDTEIVLVGNANDVTFSIAAALARLAVAQTWTAIQSFGKDGVVSFIRFVPSAGDPSTPTDGMVWYNLTTQKLRTRQNGINEDLVVAGAGEANTISSQGGGAFPLTATIPKMGIDLRVISVSNGSGMNASLAADILTLAVAATVVQTNQINTYGAFAQIFRGNGELRFRNPANTFEYSIQAAAILADRILNLPLTTVTDTLVAERVTQTLANKTLEDGYNILDTVSGFSYIVDPAILAGNVIANLPALAATDTFLFRDFAETIKNKTLDNTNRFDDLISTFPVSIITPSAGGWNYFSPSGGNHNFFVDGGSKMEIQTSQVILKERLNLGILGILMTSRATGDIMKDDGTDLKRFARGASDTVLKVNTGGTDVEYGLLNNANINGAAAIAQSKLAALVLANLPIGRAFQRYRTNSGATAIENFTEEAAFEFVIGDNSTVISTGVKLHLRVPFDCEITRATVLNMQSGSIVVDINRFTSLANFNADTKASITSSTPPTTSSARSSEDTTLTSWTVVLNQGDILEAEVDSVTTVERTTIVLRVNKRG